MMELSDRSNSRSDLCTPVQLFWAEHHRNVAFSCIDGVMDQEPASMSWRTSSWNHTYHHRLFMTAFFEENSKFYYIISFYIPDPYDNQDLVPTFIDLSRIWSQDQLLMVPSSNAIWTRLLQSGLWVWVWIFWWMNLLSYWESAVGHWIGTYYSLDYQSEFEYFGGWISRPLNRNVPPLEQTHLHMLNTSCPCLQYPYD